MLRTDKLKGCAEEGEAKAEVRYVPYTGLLRGHKSR